MRKVLDNFDENPISFGLEFEHSALDRRGNEVSDLNNRYAHRRTWTFQEDGTAGVEVDSPPFKSLDQAIKEIKAQFAWWTRQNRAIPYLKARTEHFRSQGLHFHIGRINGFREERTRDLVGKYLFPILPYLTVYASSSATSLAFCERARYQGWSNPNPLIPRYGKNWAINWHEFGTLEIRAFDSNIPQVPIMFASLLIPLVKKVIEKKNEPLVSYKTTRAFYRVWDIYLKRGINSFKANNFLYTYLFNLEDDLDLEGMPEGSKEVLFLATRGITIAHIIEVLGKEDLAKFYDTMVKSPDKFLANLERAGLMETIKNELPSFKYAVEEYQEGDFRYLADFMQIKYPNTKEFHLYCALMFLNNDLIRCGRVYKDPSRLFKKLRRLKNCRYEDIEKIILRFPEIYYKLIRPDYLEWQKRQKERNLWASIAEEIKAGLIPAPVRIQGLSTEILEEMARLINKDINYIVNCPDRFYVIIKDNQLIGFVSIRLRDGRIAHLRVKEDVRRCGVGTKLVKKCLKVLKENAPQNLAFAQIEIDNEASRKFFESLGFKLLDFERDDLPRFYFDPLTDEDLIKLEMRHPHFIGSMLKPTELESVLEDVGKLENWVRSNIEAIREVRFKWWLSHIPKTNEEKGNEIRIIRRGWECPECERRVPSSFSRCIYCNAPRDSDLRCDSCGFIDPSRSPVCPNCRWNRERREFEEDNFWRCSNCRFYNPVEMGTCARCGFERR